MDARHLLLKTDPNYEERREVISDDAFMSQLASAPIEEFRRVARDRRMRKVTHPDCVHYTTPDAANYASPPAPNAETTRQDPPKQKVAPQPPPLTVNARPAPKAAPQRDPAAEERAERQRLAATPGLSATEQLAIMTSTTAIATARFMASDQYRNMLRATAPAAAAKPPAHQEREQARLDALFGLTPEAMQTSCVPPLPQPRTQHEAEQASRLDAEFGLAEASAPRPQDERIQTFGAPPPTPKAHVSAGGDPLENELAQFISRASGPHPFK